MSKLQFLLLASSLLLCGCGSQAHWESVYQDRQITLAIDSNSIQHSGQEVKAWVMTNHTQPLSRATKRYHSEIALFRFRCTQQRFILEYANLYESRNGKGELVDAIFGKAGEQTDVTLMPGMPQVMARVC